MMYSLPDSESDKAVYFHHSSSGESAYRLTNRKLFTGSMQLDVCIAGITLILLAAVPAANQVSCRKQPSDDVFVPWSSSSIIDHLPNEIVDLFS